MFGLQRRKVVLGFRVYGLEFRVLGPVLGLGFTVPALYCKASALRFKV